MKFRLLLIYFFFFNISLSNALPIVSGISTNEINIDTKFEGAKILLFGAKTKDGDVMVVVRGPKKNFLITKKDKLFGVWYNGERIVFKDAYSFHSLFTSSEHYEHFKYLMKDLEIDNQSIIFNSSKNISQDVKNEFRLNFINQMGNINLYKEQIGKVNFLNETLFKVMLEFPKNISRGVYLVEIYLIDEGDLLSFQSIPIYVNQVGISAKISDFSKEQSVLYGLISILIALSVGWLTNFLFNYFSKK